MEKIIPGMRLGVWTAVLCCLSLPLSYAGENVSADLHSQVVSVINLEGMSSAGEVSTADGAIEFRGNALVNSVAGQMVTRGTLPPSSALAMPPTGQRMALDVTAESTPLALVEKDLLGRTSSGGIALDTFMKSATHIAREPLRIPKIDRTSPASLGAAVGSGGPQAEQPGAPPKDPK